METLVHPFSFREYLRHFKQEPNLKADRLPKATRSSLEKHLRQYLVTGGFPEALEASGRDRVDLLRGYVDVALLRDVVERHAVSHPVALRWMTRHLLGNAAGSFSINKFHGDLRSQGIPAAKDTLHAYLGHLEDAFLIRTISLASASERRRMVNPRKVYPVDPGLIPLYDRTGRGNAGHALETCVMLELERRGAEISYVRTQSGFEVDFLASFPDGRKELIQVSSDLSDTATLARETRALKEAAKELRKTPQHLISLDQAPPQGLPSDITWHSATTWLFASEPL